MNVFDGDPNKLAWRSTDGNATVISLFKPGVGLLKETALSGRTAPTDKELDELMDKAKQKSKERGASPVFLVLFRSKEKGFIPFVEYHTGKLIAFCRPPWRKGKGVM